jgi:acid phosphatase (class A)
MRQSVRVLLLVFLLLLPQQGAAGDAPFFTAEQVDLTKLLAPPPVVGSPQQQKEVAILLALQQERTPEQEAQAQADEARTAFRFADVLGQDFAASKLPLAEALFKQVQRTAGAVVSPAKDHWNRPRPFASDAAIRPCVHRPPGPSYPSSHATFGTVIGIILADMLPEKAAAIYARADLYRLRREIGGVHYPSDVEAGRIAGTVIAAFLRRDPAFLAEYATARAEVRQVLGLRP